MHFISAFALVSTLSLSSFPSLAIAQLITAENHSFGGVNFPLLQYFTPESRDDTIRAILKSKARVIRLFIRPDSHHTDPEVQLGEFDKSLLDQTDDALAAIHRISKGQIKVIIAPHDANALRGTNDVPCDAYCQKLNGAFLDFYSNEENRELYKTRLDVLFKHYPSRNFKGRNWSELSEVILGVDIQHQPFSGIWPIPSGESWLCDMATHLKFKVGLDTSNIAVISGGVSGLQTLGGIENFPDSVFDCAAIDVIGIHGRFARTENATAGTSWANMFLPGNTLTGRAQGKPGKRKLLLVEEWEYVHTTSGLEHKKEAIFDQGTALNLRGIPWLYSHLSFKNESTTPRINPLDSSPSSMSALTTVLSRAHTARSNFNWTSYLPAPLAPLTRLTEIPLNPFIPASSTCVFGCEGQLCSAADGCAPDLLCMNSVCVVNRQDQPGQVGAMCNSKKRCQGHLRCERGRCQACMARPSLLTHSGGSTSSRPPRASIGTAATTTSNNTARQSLHLCATDPVTLFLSPSSSSSSSPLPICLPPSASSLNPCDSPSHCPSTSYCSWGLCVACTPGDACLGSICKGSNACKTGFCNDHGRCDYPGQKKLVFGPGTRGRWKNGGRRIDGVPKGHERGPARVRSEAMRVVIPEEGVRETGMVGVVS